MTTKETCVVLGCAAALYRHCVWCNRPLCKECWCVACEVTPLDGRRYQIPPRSKVKPDVRVKREYQR